MKLLALLLVLFLTSSKGFSQGYFTDKLELIENYGQLDSTVPYATKVGYVLNYFDSSDQQWKRIYEPLGKSKYIIIQSKKQVERWLITKHWVDNSMFNYDWYKIKRNNQTITVKFHSGSNSTVIIQGRTYPTYTDTNRL